MSARLDVQRAMHSVLNGDTGAGGLRAAATPLVSGVFDVVPQNQPAPYLQIGEAVETPWGTFGKKGYQVVCVLRIWSESTAGFAEPGRVLERINALIADTDALAPSLNANGWRLVRCQYETSDALREADVETRQVPTRYRVWVQEL